MEERLDVNVVLIPNIHLENPHYEINRIRIDDVEEDGEPSYKRVAEPEEDESAKPFGSEKAKASRPEPAVKGVRHTQLRRLSPLRKKPLGGKLWLFRCRKVWRIRLLPARQHVCSSVRRLLLRHQCGCG